MGLIDFGHEEFWRTIEVLDKEGMDEPQVLQQKQKQALPTAPLDEHRLVPLSDLLESS